MGLLDTMKKVAEQTGQAGVPTAFLFGTVTSTSPLMIRVDNRFNIGEKQIVLMKQFRAGEYQTHKHTVPQHSTETASNHSHDVQALQTTQEVYNGLAVGDKVVLLRNQGGQEFLVLGRV